MLYIGGVIMILAGIVTFVRLYIHSKRPMVYDARVVEVFKDFYTHPKYPDHQHPYQVWQARVEYYYQSMKYETVILLKSRKAFTGATLALTIKPDNPGQPERYNPKPEIIGGIILCSAGIGIIVVCTLILDHYNLW